MALPDHASRDQQVEEDLAECDLMPGTLEGQGELDFIVGSDAFVSLAVGSPQAIDVQESRGLQMTLSAKPSRRGRSYVINNGGLYIIRRGAKFTVQVHAEGALAGASVACWIDHHRAGVEVQDPTISCFKPKHANPVHIGCSMQVFVDNVMYEETGSKYKVFFDLDEDGKVDMAIHCVGSEEMKGGGDFDGRVWHLGIKSGNIYGTVAIQVKEDPRSQSRRRLSVGTEDDKSNSNTNGDDVFERELDSIAEEQRATMRRLPIDKKRIFCNMLRKFNDPKDWGEN